MKYTQLRGLCRVDVDRLTDLSLGAALARLVDVPAVNAPVARYRVAKMLVATKGNEAELTEQAGTGSTG